MSDKHTQGRLTLELVENDTGTITHLCPVDAEDMSILTVVEHEGVKFAAVYHSEDARRLVACWNACEGLPTAWIEGGAADILEHAKSLKSQRDELLAALLECERYGGGYTNCNESYLPPTVREKARAAIAKAEAK